MHWLLLLNWNEVIREHSASKCLILDAHMWSTSLILRWTFFFSFSHFRFSSIRLCLQLKCSFFSLWKVIIKSIDDKETGYLSYCSIIVPVNCFWNLAPFTLHQPCRFTSFTPSSADAVVCQSSSHTRPYYFTHGSTVRVSIGILRNVMSMVRTDFLTNTFTHPQPDFL